MTSPFKEFFDVDGTPVEVTSDGVTVKGILMESGKPFPPAEALFKGTKVSEAEARRLAVAASA